MSAEIVNLRRVRRAKAKAGQVVKAAENRARFGRTKADRECEALEQARVRRAFEGAERAADDGKPDGDPSGNGPGDNGKSGYEK